MEGDGDGNGFGEGDTEREDERRAFAYGCGLVEALGSTTALTNIGFVAVGAGVGGEVRSGVGVEVKDSSC